MTETAEAAGAHSPAATYDGIAILGSHPETKMLAPFEGNWLIYACSPDNSPYGATKQTLPRVDVWFELHKPIAHPSRPYGYLRWLEEQPFPIYMRDHDAMPFFKTALKYPDREMKQRFGEMLFTSSIAYLIAKGIQDCETMKIPRLGIWGIMQASETEYVKHRTGTQQMLWNAHKAGLQVIAPPQAGHLFKPPPEDW